ncbi:tumor necrosis factor receptor superfamily member 3 isoform X2 [Labeo rohita]|uniref:tumor necrosis factor receptor superfamily member 3 isoform X2 n=1 Tax=Labeo rohita TaxID=84645 RepID=UPI0021E1F32B|nr:tumor necrosis factor receptor superfamily member 3 isoform X2 [Labeo rohita]
MCHSESSHASFFSSSKMLALLSVLLLTSHVLPLVQSQTCNERTQYSNDNRCCDKCQPGQYVTQKCTAKQSKTVCETCKDGYYMDDYNGSYNFCKHCTKCTKDHMRTKEVCTATRDTVCDCDKGYRCSDSICQACEKIPVSTTLSTTPPHSTPLKQNNFTKTVQPINDMHDHVDGSCQHQPVSAAPTRATLDPVSAQKKRRFQCQCRRCVERMKNWRMSEKRAGRRPLMRLWIEYLL